MTGYGPMDILWLDGGWVRPYKSIDQKVDWQKSIRHNQDIDMARIAKMARTHQPGLLVGFANGGQRQRACTDRARMMEAIHQPRLCVAVERRRGRRRRTRPP